MKCLSIFAALLLVTLALPSSAQQPLSPTYKVDVKLVRLLVNVKDSQGALVGSLDAKDFSVLDCDVPQSISVFERQTELPLSIAVLL